MKPSSDSEDQSSQNSWSIAAAFDGGELDCGNGLLLLIRKHIDPLPAGALLEIRSRESSVREDLPAWCRMTGNDLVHADLGRPESKFLVCKGLWTPPLAPSTGEKPQVAIQPEPPEFLNDEARLSNDRNSNVRASLDKASLSSLPMPTDRSLELSDLAELVLPPLPIMGIGSWPRPVWLLPAIQSHLSGAISEGEFQSLADSAVRLAIQSQEQASVDVVTDGEQRRDNYASFVGKRLANCQLIPLTDLLPYVDHPDDFRRSLDSLDVPADQVRHPAVFGRISRRDTLALHEFEFARQWTSRPIKVSLPGPYLLSRTMWMECISDRYYSDRESLADDVVQVLREELIDLLRAGVALVQFDEPVLTEIVMGRHSHQRSFMCGALGEKLPIPQELAFVEHLYDSLMRGLPQARVGVHLCRGNWSRDESVALSGNYQQLVETLARLPLGNYWLEMCTPRAGEWDCLLELPSDRRIGVGVINQKLDHVEPITEIASRIEKACRVFGEHRVMLTPDCGFATFADRPLANEAIAVRKLTAIVRARAEFWGGV